MATKKFTVPNRSTRTDLGEEEYQKFLLKQKEAEAKKSDEELLIQKIQNMPKPQPTPTETPRVNPTNPEVFKDVTSGKLSGVTLPDGRTFLGLSPDKVKDVVSSFQESRTIPEGAQAAGTAQKALNTQLETQQLMQGITGEPIITEQDILNAVPQEPTLEGLQTSGAAGIGAVAGGLGGAKLGALLGTSLAPGLGTAIGAVGGAVLGAIGGAYTKITLKQRNDATQALKVSKIADVNFGQTIDSLNAGILPKDIALRRFKQDKIALYAARANLKRLTDNELDRFLSGGADELATINDRIRDLETIYEPEFIIALSAPNPNNIKYSFMRPSDDE